MDLRISVSLCLFMVVLAQTKNICPLECLCYLDGRGRNVVECKRGGMTGPLHLTNITTDIEVLKITAPEDNMNELSMTPAIRDYSKLEEIHITRSNLRNLGVKFFFGLNKLHILNLSQNNVWQPLPDNFFNLIRLQELYLDDNHIDSLPSETFKHLIDLRILSVQRNRIENIIAGVFRGLSKLRVLKLTGNRLKLIEPDAFRDIKELRALECRGCSLTTINPHINELLPHLTHLDFGENELREIKPADFVDLKRLKVLKLDGNQLTSIPDEAWTNHADLKRISLARNAIVRIEANAFYNLDNLTELDLGYNKMRHVYREVLHPISESLEKLVLSGNHISLMELKDALETTELKVLELADIGLADVEESFVPDSVEILNLSGNQLSYLPSYVLPGNLRELDISRNMFRGLEKDVVERIQSIRCRLDNNPWSCDLCHIIPMLEKVNNSQALFNVRCALPYHHSNKILGTLQREQLSWCNAAGYSSEGANFFLTRDDGRLGLIAAGASALLLLITATAALVALCYSRRHAANYYTHEEKRLDERESIFENQSPLFGEELSFKFPLDLSEKKISIATIDEIKKEHAVSNGT